MIVNANIEFFIADDMNCLCLTIYSTCTVRKELSELDRSILRDEGLSLPQGKKRRCGQDDQPASSSDEKYSKR